MKVIKLCLVVLFLVFAGCACKKGALKSPYNKGCVDALTHVVDLISDWRFDEMIKNNAILASGTNFQKIRCLEVNKLVFNLHHKRQRINALGTVYCTLSITAVHVTHTESTFMIKELKVISSETTVPCGADGEKVPNISKK